ncbi:MAG: alanine racemase [Bacilli bacterium]|nr:alanine racemase [Bacilli bacterium]
MYRKTYATIDGNILKENINKIINKYNSYQYYIGVVKNNAYNHGMYVVNDLIAGGINYLAVANFDEALHVRKYNIEIPVLLLEPIDIEYIYDCINNNVTITIERLDYLKKLIELDLRDDLKIHLKIDSGMNRLGFKTKDEINTSIKLINETNHLILEGIYTDFATNGINDPYWDIQLSNFKELTSDINLKNIPIVHLGKSETLIHHDKIGFCNGVRLGLIMYGIVPSYDEGGFFKKTKRNIRIKKYDISDTYLNSEIDLKTAFILKSEVMSIRHANVDEFVGFGAHIKVVDDMNIATIPVGYADGIDKKYNVVSINNELCDILSDSMDMLMVKVNDNVKVGDEVEIFGNNINIDSVMSTLDIDAYHLFNNITTRVPRLHLRDKEKEEVKY